ncbi:prenyltransferase/squalene oxidase repeat-containing protein [Streptomyces sp. NPDC047108]|uniref:prenyltransferase/squalene oxidase repeat-containing protein n=1 Tax=Streptomyces sp. NPDC047108 TaxID=3155025 RepID=UPI003406F27C
MQTSPLRDHARTAVTAGTEWLFARRGPDGVFTPPGDRFSPGNTAVALMALWLTGSDDGDGGDGDDQLDRTSARAVARLLETQRSDGGWAMSGVPTELLATALVTDVLDIIGGRRATWAVRAGRRRIEALGGAESLPEPVMAGLVEQFGVLTGRSPHDALRRLPSELLLLPGMARRLLSLRLPIFAAMALGQSAQRRPGPARRWLDSRARPTALSLVREVYEHGGATGGFSTDPWLTGLICIGVARSDLAPDIAESASDWLRSAASPDGGWDLMPLDLTWSGFAGAALLEAGRGDDPRLAATRAMFRDRHHDAPFSALACPPGYWGFSDERSWPMALETAEISSLLRRLPGGADDPHAREGVDWLTRMQDSRGSWSLAVRNSGPGGFGPCPQMTAKAVLALLDHGAETRDPRVRKALRWLTSRQDPDGSFEALWYRGRTPGTAAVLEAFCRAHGFGHPVARKARDWLLRARQADGSWGTGRCQEPGTAEETAWALHALLTAGMAPDDEVAVGAARRLLAAQLEDGGWQGGPVNEYVRLCSRYSDDVIACGLAVRALARLCGPGTAEDGA